MRPAAGLLLAALAVPGCGRDGERDRGPYVVEVDLAPQIRAFGEETLVADEAAERLAAIGPAVIPALAAALEREAKDVRQKAVEVLSTIGTAEAVPPLLRAAEHDADDDVRSDALIALGTIGDERGRALVERAIDDPRVLIRGGGVMGCATLCTSPAAIGRLADIAVRDDIRSIALAARRTLASLRERGPAEEQAVRDAVARRRPAALPAGASPDERALAALLASDLDGADGIPALLAVLGDASPPLQRQMAWRLGTLGDELDAVGGDVVPDAARGARPRGSRRRLEQEGEDRVPAAQRLAIVDAQRAVVGEERHQLVEPPSVRAQRIARHEIPDRFARRQLLGRHDVTPPPRAASTASEDVTVASSGMMLSIEKRCHASG